MILPESRAEQALPLMRGFEEGRQATVIGRITKQSGEQARVKMKTLYGNYRIIDMLKRGTTPPYLLEYLIAEIWKIKDRPFTKSAVRKASPAGTS